jgi:hypothetical protein
MMSWKPAFRQGPGPASAAPKPVIAVGGYPSGAFHSSGAGEVSGAGSNLGAAGIAALQAQAWGVLRTTI